MDLNSKEWSGKRVLVTGHTGFKGSWLTLLLKDLGAEVIGISLMPESSRSMYFDAKIKDVVQKEFFLDIRDQVGIEKAIQKSNLDYVFHLAAQPYVRRSIRNPIESISTNVCGTANVLLSSLKAETMLGVTVVSTDKVYKNVGNRAPFKELNLLGGADPYSGSKAAAELIVDSVVSSNNPMSVNVTTVRAGNVIGGGDWGEERLVPDLVRSIETNSTLAIRNPNSTRPWQHVLDCLYGYLLVGQSHLQKDKDVPKSVNFGPTKSLSVTQLISLFEEAFGKKIPFEILGSAIPENDWLELDATLANQLFGWYPVYSPAMAVRQSAEWYSGYLSGADALELSHEEIAKYKVGKW